MIVYKVGGVVAGADHEYNYKESEMCPLIISIVFIVPLRVKG